ncbi:MAG: hypothetical protein RMJ34_07380 [candidate division WOR-3 bacterium]|nr:hypothetical protein [candidate division WOR-3 bacterium]
MKGKTVERLCAICQTNKAIVFLNEEGLPENEPICNSCSEEIAWGNFQDEFREMTKEEKTELFKETKKMNDKLNSRQYAKLEPSQKILNTLLMTLGSEWLRDNIDNTETLKKIVDIAVYLADEMVEKLYKDN